MASFVLLLLSYHTNSEELKSNQCTYKAAVYEHSPVTGETPQKTLMKNLDVYLSQIHQAASEGADIIVFPEYGLVGIPENYGASSREGLAKFGTTVPDPLTESYNFCLNPGENALLNTLSCAAMNNSITVVANMVEIRSCDSTDKDAECPDDGFWLYNTDVVIDEDGKLLRRSRKRHPYDEPYINPRPLSDPLPVFETKFGRFAVIICFDLLFPDTSMKVLEREGIDNVVFSTAWPDYLPFSAATQIHPGWALRTGVNLLSANIHYGTHAVYSAFSGSGIYSGLRGPLGHTYNHVIGKGKLVVSELPCKPQKLDSSLAFPQKITTHVEDDHLQAQSTPEEGTLPTASVEVKKLTREGLDLSVVPLLKSSDTVTVCDNSLCCTFEYTVKSGMKSELYALIAADGVFSRQSESMRFQLCVMSKCAGTNYTSCVEPVFNAYTSFEHFKLSGNFSTNFIVPSVLSNGALVTPLDQWGYSAKPAMLYSNHGVKGGVHSAGLFGYFY